MSQINLKTHPWPAMACGGCGGRVFQLFSSNKAVEVLVECQGCESVSRISVSTPELSIDWRSRFDGKDSDGLLTPGY